MAGAAYISTTLTADGSVQQRRDDPSFVFGARQESLKNVAENLHNYAAHLLLKAFLLYKLNRRFGTNGQYLQH